MVRSHGSPVPGTVMAPATSLRSSGSSKGKRQEQRNPLHHQIIKLLLYSSLSCAASEVLKLFLAEAVTPLIFIILLIVMTYTEKCRLLPG